jgi:tRNA dimethylallyltransferase
VNFSKKLITILGPTAAGKTKFAAQLAYDFDGEIISADSRQVYIGMDIGTGKDYKDYLIDGTQIRSHLVDLVKPNCEFNLYLYTQLFKKAFTQITENKKLPFLVGGTGLYLSSVIQNYSLELVDFNSPRFSQLAEYSIERLTQILKETKPELHNTTDLLDKERIIKAIMIAEKSKDENEAENQLDHLIIGISDEREIVKERIRTRLKQRLQGGMVQEVEELLKNGISHEKLRFFGLEYKYLSMYLEGELNYNDMHQKLASAIIQFSKRQMTWFRKMEKEGVKIHWLKNNQRIEAGELITSFINSK